MSIGRPLPVPAAARSEERTLILLGKAPPEGIEAEIAQGLAPRLEYFELARTLHARVLSFADVTGPLARPLSLDRLSGSALAAFLRRSDFDIIYATGEDLGLRLAPLLRLAGWPGKLVVVVHSCLSELRKAYFRALGPAAFHVLICVCEAQRRVLVEELGFPPEMVRLCVNWIDTAFFSPAAGAEAEADPPYVFACGRENRDYATLLAAAARLPMAVRIAASGFRAERGGLQAPCPPNATVFSRRVSFAEIRRSYAGARVVAAPIRPTSYAAGVTGILEGMAMGKPVVVTASPGIMDYVEDGVSGRVVPPRDPDALAAAIAELWADPGRCEEIGRRNRAWVEANAGIGGYVEAVTQLMAGARARRPPKPPAPPAPVGDRLDLTNA